jgi:hypothetical protein
LGQVYRKLVVHIYVLIVDASFAFLLNKWVAIESKCDEHFKGPIDGHGDCIIARTMLVTSNNDDELNVLEEPRATEWSRRQTCGPNLKSTRRSGLHKW